MEDRWGVCDDFAGAIGRYEQGGFIAQRGESRRKGATSAVESIQINSSPSGTAVIT